MGAADHNAAVGPLLSQLVKGRTEDEIWVLLESLCMGVGLYHGRDAKGTATFIETMAERMFEREFPARVGGR